VGSGRASGADQAMLNRRVVLDAVFSAGQQGYQEILADALPQVVDAL
jgi:hypothetical protein